ncbi:MAG: hypothetical protein ACTS6G_04195 [Candidatus Hodgkinia cicadicola]
MLLTKYGAWPVVLSYCGNDGRKQVLAKEVELLFAFKGGGAILGC